MLSIILCEEVSLLLKRQIILGPHVSLLNLIIHNKEITLILLFPPGEEGATEEGKDVKDGKMAKAKRSHFGRAVSLKNFILRKGKSTSVELGEGAKEEDEEAAEEEGGAAEGEGGAAEVEGGAAEGAEGGGLDGEAATATEETNDKAAVAEKTPAAESAAEAPKEAEKVSAEAPVTNGENGCSNGMAEETVTNNHQEEEEKTTGSSPVKKSKEAGGVKDEANAKIINTTAAVNSGELERGERDSDEPQNSSKDGDTNNRQQQLLPLTNNSCKQTQNNCPESELALEVSEEVGGEREEEESSKNGDCDNVDAESRDQGDREEEEEMRKRDLREAAVAIVQNVMSAATDQLERELCVDNGLSGCCDGEY